jgi:hypothetical protein
MRKLRGIDLVASEFIMPDCPRMIPLRWLGIFSSGQIEKTVLISTSVFENENTPSTWTARFDPCL